MSESLQNAMAGFEDTLAELAATQARLESIRATAPPDVWNYQHNRLTFAQGQVCAVQLMVVKLAAAFKGATRGSKLALPAAAESTALAGLRGGTMILSGVIYGAKQFIDSVENPGAPSMLGGTLAGINWAALGGVIGLLEGSIRK